MSTTDKKYLEGLAKVSAEETSFLFGGYKIAFPIISIVLFGLSIYLFNQVDFSHPRVFQLVELPASIVLMVIAIGFAISSWRTRKVQSKVKHLLKK